MIITLGALLLASATSMLVNDYYDARSGVDAANFQASSSTAKDTKNALEHDAKSKKPLAAGSVPLPVAKRFLYYLYASLLLSVPFVPGTAAQFSVVAGAILTFLYTQHLKPLTWCKNALCAGVIGFAPLTSGMAAAAVLGQRAGVTGPSVLAPALSSLSRLVLTLTAGFMSREILMDVVDADGDREAGVVTVPVRYGRRFASRSALGFAALMTVLAVSGPAERVLNVGAGAWMSVSGGGFGAVATAVAGALGANGGDVARLLLATVSTGMMVRNAIKVCRTDGTDVAVAENAVEESKMTFVALLASFL